MSIQAFMPGDDVVSEISTGLAAYNQERIGVYSAQKTRRPLFVGLAAIVVAVVAGLSVIPLMNGGSGIPFGIAVVAGIFALGFVWEWTGRPGKRLQQGLRDRMIPKAFGFIQGVAYKQGVQPDSYIHMPQAAVGSHNRRAFDDIVSGTHKGFPFEVYEATLSSKQGKSTTEVFKGIVMAFKVDKPFPGILVATKNVGSVSKFFRDLFGGGGLVQVESGDAELDRLYEFRSDRPDDARRLMSGGFRHALDSLRDRWPESTGRVALSGSDGFVLLPTRKNFFELPTISMDCQYKAHIEPMVTDICALLTIAEEVKEAVEK